MERLNPFIKALTVLLAGIIISFSYSALLNGILTVVCLFLLLFFSKARPVSILKVILPATLAAASLFFAALFHTNGEAAAALTASESLNFGMMTYSITSFSNALQLALRIYAYAVLGMLFALTTEGEDFLYSLMHQCRLSPKFAYGILASFHLVPVIKKEYQNVKLAYQVRGYKLTPFSLKPVFSMLVNTMHWSENIAMAMESKGFDGDGRRTYYQSPRVHWYDILFLLVMNLSLAAGVIFF